MNDAQIAVILTAQLQFALRKILKNHIPELIEENIATWAAKVQISSNRRYSGHLGGIGKLINN
jgi:hypothetical protein